MKHVSFGCFLAVLTAAVFAGCSVGAPEEPAKPPQASDKEAAAQRASAKPDATPTPAPRYIEQEDVTATPDGSAREAFYKLWFAVQYRDMLTAYDLMSADFRRDFARSLPRFSEYVMADYRRWLSKPKVLFTTKTNNGESLAVSYRPPGGSEERFATTFTRESGRWKVAYDFYLAQRLSAK